jgi:hypothetical protein
MNINVARATKISKNWSLEARKSPAPNATPEMLRRNFLSSVPRGLKNLLPALPLRGQAAPPAVKPPAVRAGKRRSSQFKLQGTGNTSFLLWSCKRIRPLYLSEF